MEEPRELALDRLARYAVAVDAAGVVLLEREVEGCDRRHGAGDADRVSRHVRGQERADVRRRRRELGLLGGIGT
jgi:hypothetical protein